MGTTFHVTVVAPPAPLDRHAVADGVAAALGEVDRQMSTYRADSELSRFNRAPPGEWVPVSGATAEVVAKALEVHALSDGAFDVTVGPLVDLWGFGAGSRGELRVPSDEELATAARNIGSKELGVRLDEPALIKYAERRDRSVCNREGLWGRSCGAVAAGARRHGLPGRGGRRGAHGGP
jgi:thiamine biosynthesis lipoprotein